MRSGLLALVLAPLLLTAACAGGVGDDPQQPLGAPPSLPTTAPALWNPCDALEPDRVAKLFGVDFEQVTGTAQEPACSFLPDSRGEPAIVVNYQLYPGTLSELVDTFGVPTEGTEIDVTTPRVTGSDDARLLVSIVDDTLAVTGFVQTGDLVQLINGLDPAPFDRANLEDGVRRLMADVAERAATAGVGG